MTNKLIELILELFQFGAWMNKKGYKVCRIGSTDIDVRVDQMGRKLTVDLPKDMNLEAEEVIRHLESDAVNARTRCVLYEHIAKEVTEFGTRLVLYLRSEVESWTQLDIIDAISAFLAKRGVALA